MYTIAIMSVIWSYFIESWLENTLILNFFFLWLSLECLLTVNDISLDGW